MAVIAFVRNYSPYLQKQIVKRLDEYCANDPLKRAWISASLDERWKHGISVDQKKFLVTYFDRLPFEIQQLHRRLIWTNRIGWTLVPILLSLALVAYRGH
jgi:hypothetical protein